MSLEDAVAAETSLELDGKRYDFAPLTVRAWGRLIRWSKDEYLATVMAAAAHVPDRALRQELIDRALVFVGRISITASETDPEAFAAFESQLGSMEGAQRIITESLLCAKRNGCYPTTDITDDFVDKLLARAGNVGELVKRIVTISTATLKTWAGTENPGNPPVTQA